MLKKTIPVVILTNQVVGLCTSYQEMIGIYTVFKKFNGINVGSNEYFFALIQIIVRIF
jgi:hypothetical protein